MKQTKFENLRYFEIAMQTALEKSKAIVIRNETYKTNLNIQYIDKNGNNFINKIYYKKNDDNTITVLDYKKEKQDKNYFTEYFKQQLNKYKDSCTSLIILEYKPLSEDFIKTAIIKDEEKIKEIFKVIDYKEIVKINPGWTEINVYVSLEYFNTLVLDKKLRYYTI